MQITPTTAPTMAVTRTPKVRVVKAVEPKSGKAAKPKVISKAKPAIEVASVKPKRKTLTKKLTAPMVDWTPMIATAAYFLAERRQFAPGHELDDWLAAERLIRS